MSDPNDEVADAAQGDGEIPEAALQSHGGQRLEPKTLEEAEPIVDGMTEVFGRWFDRFNEHLLEGRGAVEDGYVSLKHACEIVEDAGMRGVLVDVISACVCMARHMHARPFLLPRGWLTDDETFVIDLSSYRVREVSRSDHPPNYFAVQVREQDLLDSMREIANSDGRGAAVGRVGAGEWSEPLRLAEASDASYHAADLVVPLRSRRDELVSPRGCRIVLTNEGFLAVWYGTPRNTEAEAVAEAWRTIRSK